MSGAFTSSSSFSGDKLNTLVGLMINALQHGMIYVGLGILPAANRPDGMYTLQGPGPDAQNRVGSFVGPMAASFQVPSEEAPGTGDLETAEAAGRRIAEVTRRFKARRHIAETTSQRPHRSDHIPQSTSHKPQRRDRIADPAS